MNSFKKSCRVSNPEGVAALFACGLMGLSIVLLVPEKPRIKLAAVGSLPQLEKTDIESVAGEVEAVPEKLDLVALVKFCSQHTTSSRGFVIFRNGSCVLIPEPCDDPVAKAREVMGSCAEPENRFLTERTMEGDLLVTFTESVFQRIPAEEIENLDAWSLENLSLLLSEKEKELAKPGWVPPVNARLGLVGRRMLQRDAMNGEIVKILRPNTAVAKTEG